MERWVAENAAVTQRARIASLEGVGQIDYLPYMDELADIIGCKPNIGERLDPWCLLNY